MTITAAADGSSLGNPGPAGWAWYVDEDTWDAGGWPQGTNNLGELTAILHLLEATAETGEELHILADSQYAINVVSKWRLGWKKRGWTKADKKPIKNLELIQEIDRAMEGRRVTFEWVKGHAGHRMNERADDLARACAEAYQAGRTPEPGPGFGGGGSRDGAKPGASTPVGQEHTEADTATATPASRDAIRRVHHINFPFASQRFLHTHRGERTRPGGPGLVRERGDHRGCNRPRARVHPGVDRR